MLNAEFSVNNWVNKLRKFFFVFLILNSYRETEDAGRVKPAGELTHSCYNVEFTFDSDVKCAITIYYFATEEITNKQAV